MTAPTHSFTLVANRFRWEERPGSEETNGDAPPMSARMPSSRSTR